MSRRTAARALDGQTVADVEIVEGVNSLGHRVVSIRPNWRLRSGVINVSDPAVMRRTVLDMWAALDFLEGQEHFLHEITHDPTEENPS